MHCPRCDEFINRPVVTGTLCGSGGQSRALTPDLASPLCGVMGSASQTLFYGTSNAGTWGGGVGLSAAEPGNYTLARHITLTHYASTRHASHGNGGSRFELELDRRNAARGNAGSRAPRSIDGAQVGVSSDYHKTQPASNEGSRARARCPSFTPDRGGINRSLREPAVRSVAAALTPLSDPLYLSYRRRRRRWWRRKRPRAALECRVQQGDIVVSLGKCSGADARLCCTGWGDLKDPRPDCHAEFIFSVHHEDSVHSSLEARMCEGEDTVLVLYKSTETQDTL
ncbi:hypothetical protein Q8A73_014861 [Channa argus]|nr:hypothetical protein Q8A73_014861 [Channa argus]